MKTYQYGKINFVADTVAGQTVEAFCEQNKGNYFLNESEDVRIEKLCAIHEACCKLAGKDDAIEIAEPVVPVNYEPEAEHKEE